MGVTVEVGKGWQDRIYKRKLYLVALPQGISGFSRPPVAAVVTGLVVRSRGYDPWEGRSILLSRATFRMEDGRLPEYQPRGDIARVREFLVENPCAAAVVVDRGDVDSRKGE